MNNLAGLYRQYAQLWEAAQKQLQRCLSRGWISIREGIHLKSLEE